MGVGVGEGVLSIPNLEEQLDASKSERQLASREANLGDLMPSISRSEAVSIKSEPSRDLRSYLAETAQALAPNPMDNFVTTWVWTLKPKSLSAQQMRTNTFRV